MDKKSGSGSGIRIRDPNPGSESGMNNPDHISESLETYFWVKILKFFDADQGSGMEKIRDPGWNKFGSGIRDKHLGSATPYFITDRWRILIRIWIWI
jgi:hypothetical protein